MKRSSSEIIDHDPFDLFLIGGKIVNRLQVTNRWETNAFKMLSRQWGKNVNLKGG